MYPITTHPRAAAALAAFAALGLAACGGSDHSAPQSAAAAQTTVSAQQACETLKGKTIGGASVDTATMVDATAASPTYCKVNATVAPSLVLELDLPNNWNGKLLYSGGGGYDGVISGLMFSPGVLAAGYAVVQSNGGHIGSSAFDASFALDPNLAYLFGPGSVPTVTAVAKEMLQATFGKNPERSYFEGCSNGGREALMAAQREPSLFDGIIARAPAYDWPGFTGAFNRNAKAISAPGAAFTTAKVALLAKAVRDACDAKDGIVDGLVSNQSTCNFDPGVLRCPAGADTGDTCLSDAQLGVVNTWTTPVSFGNGAYKYQGWALSGNEDEQAGLLGGAWNTWLTGSTGNGSDSVQFLLQDATVKYYLARDAKANSLAYDWDSNQQGLFTLAALNSATNADLRPFMNNGGKLILWHGTNDMALSHRATTAYYESVKAAVGGQSTLDKFVRYYQAPGVDHCAGGPGADSVNLVVALDKWVTQGTDPGQPTASKIGADGSAAFTRPLCQYPQYPRYTGPANDVNAAKLASNYTCTTPS